MPESSRRPALLLLNLGTPDAPDTKSVRRYLKEFLSDPYVIDIPALARWALVNLIILPTRPKKSAAAYREVWTKRGSPLLFHSRDLETKMRQRLVPEDFVAVELGMRYGNPSIRSALEKLRAQRADRIVVAPLYPQYALSSTATGVEKVRGELAAMGWDVKWDVLEAFHSDPGFIAAVAGNVKREIGASRFDHLLVSFHGLPERHIRKTDRSGGRHCLVSPSCCATLVDANRDCYRAQSFATSRKLREVLGWPSDRLTVSFQSRLGRTPWIQPFTDVELAELPKRGVKRLLVVCPSFVADCLETLEEIKIRGAQIFKEAGGEELVYVPAVNSQDDWAEALAQLVLKV
jgi:ferrochelatase